MVVSTKIVARLKTIPNDPGVYLMKNKDGNIIYIGKAVNLSKRVRSYFNRQHEDIKTRQLVEKIVDIEWIVTDNELEALMLETNLIKKNRPKYNILMKDDKYYAYIKITSEEFPRVLVVRKVNKDGGKYFGPYSNATGVEELLKILNRIFPFFTYNNQTGVSPMDSVAGKELFEKRSKSIWGYLQEREVYAEMIRDFIKVLKGSTAEVIKEFRLEMQKSSKNKDFEKAAWIRDRIKDISRIMDRQKVISTKKENWDVIGIFGENQKWIVSLVYIREGKLIDVQYFEMKGHIRSEVVFAFVSNYYIDAQEYPQKLLLPVKFESGSDVLLTNFLKKISGRKILVISPEKGLKKDMVGLAMRNAELEYRRRMSIVRFARFEGAGIVELLKELSSSNWEEYRIFDKWRAAKKDYFRIEGYDISNLGDEGVVGALVSWILKIDKKKNTIDWQTLLVDDLMKYKGGFDKAYYKRFEIKETSGQDDFGAMREVFGRRFRKKDAEKWIWPDLLLVDGGKGQLGIVLSVLKLLKVEIPVVALAKREEEIWLGRIDDHGEIIYKSLNLAKDSLASLLMQNIRNEVHRFAVSYQRIIRRKGIRKSILDQIDGLGPKRKKVLLEKFGSTKGIKEAGWELVAEVVGKKIADEIFKIL